MNWLKKNPFFFGILLVCVGCVGGEGYLLYQSLTAYVTASEELTAGATTLHTFQNKAPFPSDTNLKTLSVAFDNYASRVADFRAQLAKMQIPLDESVTPQHFQDGLRSAVNEIRKKADASNVKLPEKFYFGFDQYQAQVPSEFAAPYLRRELVVIEALVSRLIDFKVQSINELVRQPLPQEEASAAAAAAAATAAKKPLPQPIMSRHPFDISFTAEQGKFRVAGNSLLSGDRFLILRSLRVTNTKLKAPSKSGAMASPFAAPTPDSAGAGAKNLNVILGRELINVSLRLEVLNFSKPVAATAAN